MLFHIVNAKTERDFLKYYKCIERAFYDEKDYKKSELLDVLPDWKRKEIPEKEEDQIEEVNNSLDRLIAKVCDKSPGMYFFKGKSSERHLFPFVKYFHEYFLKHRKWNTPLRDPGDHVDELFRLHKQAKLTKKEQNYSAKSGDHNHFVNTVAATARLINYFSNPVNIQECFNKSNYLTGDTTYEKYTKTISYDLKNHGKRIFTLVLASFFHDIGKTIVYHRHGMEGFIIISEHTSNSWYQIKKIAELYKFGSSFDREDLLFVADLLDFHDQFGTLSTGEAGYQKLVDIIERIKRYSLLFIDHKEQIEWSERYLFDLWLLNIADIIVSVEYKFGGQIEGKLDKQIVWMKKETANKRIDDFFQETEKCKNLVHDLKIAKSLLRESNKHRHSDVCCQISQRAKSLSDRHVVERIRRLVYSSINTVAKKEDKKRVEWEGKIKKWNKELNKASNASTKNKKIIDDLKKKIQDGKRSALFNFKNIFPYFKNNNCLTEFELNSSIVKSIESVECNQN